VFPAALDASKAFDRVNHFSLFIALMKNGIALPYIRVIIFLHLYLSAIVRWGGYLSDVITINGIRQGGIFSPGFFFINDLLVILRDCSLGCYMSDVYCGCIFFADEISLLSASVDLCKLQMMLDLCITFASAVDLKFNQDKSRVLNRVVS
jgi:hypothetical protein